MREILTVRQVAEYLQVDERTVYKLARKREVPSMKILGQWRFKKELIDAWIDAKCLKNGNLNGKWTKTRKTGRKSVSLVAEG